MPNKKRKTKGNVKLLTKEQKRVKEIIQFLSTYFSSYDQQFGYLDYTDETIINDTLYGLGVALDEKYRMATGFELFKKDLAKKIMWNTLSK